MTKRRCYITVCIGNYFTGTIWSKRCMVKNWIMPLPLSSTVGAQAPCTPPSRRNVAVLSHAEYVPTLTATAVQPPYTLRPRWVKRPGDLNLESGVRVTCDVGYLCANFSLPRPLCSRVRPDVRDRQTDVRQEHRLMPPPIRVDGIVTGCCRFFEILPDAVTIFVDCCDILVGTITNTETSLILKCKISKKNL